MSITVTFRLEEEELERLDRIARNEGMTRQDLLRVVVRGYMKDAIGRGILSVASGDDAVGAAGLSAGLSADKQLMCVFCAMGEHGLCRPPCECDHVMPAPATDRPVTPRPMRRPPPRPQPMPPPPAPPPPQPSATAAAASPVEPPPTVLEQPPPPEPPASAPEPAAPRSAFAPPTAEEQEQMERMMRERGQ